MAKAYSVAWAALVCMTLSAGCIMTTARVTTSPARTTLVADSVVDPEALNFPTGRYGTCINGQTIQQEAVTSFQGWQYATYFDGHRRLCVARRQLPEGQWERIAFDDYKIASNDTHNITSMGICPQDGTIHLSFDHHAGPLHYRVSAAGAATSPEKTKWTAALFTPTKSELEKGKRLSRVTYPAFFVTPDGRLGFYYRVGGSGDGDSCLAFYEPAAGWRMGEPFVSGKGNFQDSTARNAYHNGFDYDPSGRLHTTWTWRENKDNATRQTLNVHDLNYAYSDDAGRTWRSNDGKLVFGGGAAAMTIDTPGLLVQQIPYLWGVMNSVAQTVDAVGRVHVVLWQNPPDAPAASANVKTWKFLHYSRDEHGKWRQQQLPFVGGKPTIVTDRDGSLLVIVRKPKEIRLRYDLGGAVHVFRASAKSGWKDWQEVAKLQGEFEGVPRIDKSRWQKEHILSIYVQEAPAEAGKPTPLHVFDLKP